MITFDNPRARGCRRALVERLKAIDGDDDPMLDAERDLIERMLEFDFEAYPDYTAPWHLLTWPSERMRWWHVYHIVQIIESLRQPTGSHMGEPIRLQAFQVMILVAFLGPVNDSGLRVVKEGLLTLARKNAKTTLVAAMVTALMCLHPDDHGFKGQEIQVGASDRDQAGITHQMVERFTQMDATLGIAEKFRSVPSKKLISHIGTLTQLRCLSSDAHRHHGGNPVMVLLDELGNVTASAAEEFYSVLTTGFGAQEEPLTLMFSTQAPNDQHFFSLQVDRAKRINDGSLQDESFAGFVYSVPEMIDGQEIDPFDESLWYLANPGLDTILSRTDIRDWAKRARELPSLENKFRLLKLNQRVSETSAFMSRTVWTQNAGAKYSAADLYGQDCYIGIDLAETTDLVAVVALFDEQEDGRMPVMAKFFIPGDDLMGRVKRDKVPYDVWVKQGYVDASSHRVVDYGTVAEEIVTMINDFNVRAIGFDRWKMKHLRKELRDRGYEWEDDDPFLIEIGQGFKDQSRSVEVLEGLALNHKLAHGDNPVLTWCAANAVIVRDPARNRKFEKAKSYGRIDGIVALALAAHARDFLGIEDTGPSVYDDESVAVFM